MPCFDHYGLEISSSGPAVDTWQAGLDASLAFDQSGIIELSEAVRLEPDFALAHVLLARQQMIYGQWQQGQQSLAMALSLSTKVSKREASQIDVTAKASSGDPKSLALAKAHLSQWPTDVFVFAQIVGPFGLLAFSGQSNWREQCLALLEQYATKFPANDWWFLSTLAFALAETGDLLNAENVAEHAWDIAKKGTCAHSLSHVHFELGALETGIEYINHWANECGGTKSDMCHHLRWHEALFNLELGNSDAGFMQTVYRQYLDPKVSDPMPLSTYSDNASLLWRCALSDYQVPAQFISATVSYGKQHFADVGFAFADIHTIVITALSKDKAVQNELLEKLYRLEDFQVKNLLVQLHNGMSAFANGDFTQSASLLKGTLDKSVGLGGSNPQRRIVEESYLAACMNAGDKESAIALLEQRLTKRPSPFDEKLLATLR